MLDILDTVMFVNRFKLIYVGFVYGSGANIDVAFVFNVLRVYL